MNKLLLILLVFVLFFPGVNAFMETSEYHPYNDPEIVWSNSTYAHGSESWTDGYYMTGGAGNSHDGYSVTMGFGSLYQNITSIYSYMGKVWGCGHAYTHSYLINNEMLYSDYFSFKLNRCMMYRGDGANRAVTLYVDFYDTNNSNLITSTLWTYSSTGGGNYWVYGDPPTQYEFKILGNQLYMIKNGTSSIFQGAWSDYDIGYVRFRLYTNCGTNNEYTMAHVYLDDFTTSDTIGIGAERPHNYANTHIMSRTELDPPNVPAYQIAVSYTLNTLPSASYESAEYKLNVKKIISGEIINSTVIKPIGQGSSDIYPPFGEIIYNRSTLFGDNYSIYQFYLTKNDQQLVYDTISWKNIDIAGNSWVNTKETVFKGAVTNIEYLINPYDAANYNYYVRVYNPYFALSQEYTLGSASGNKTYDTAGKDIGIYIIILVAKDTSTNIEYEVAYSIFEVKEGIEFSGMIYNAENGEIISGANISMYQSGAWFNSTSDINGTYTSPEMSSGFSTMTNVSKINFTHEEFSITAPTSGEYIVNLYMFPNNITRTTHAVEGMIMEDALHQGLFNASVNIYNSTWSDNMTSNNLGYYIFDGLWCNSTNVINEIFNSGALDIWVSLGNDSLVIGSQVVKTTDGLTTYTNNTDYVMNYTDGTIQVLSGQGMGATTDYHINYSYYLPTLYHVNSTLPGYEDSIEYLVTVNSWAIQNILLKGLYSLNVTAVDSVTGAQLHDFTASIGSETKTTTNGTITFILNYGLYAVSVTADNYYSVTKNVLVDENEDIQLSLIPVDSQYYSPHYVEFIVCSIWGVKYPDVLVNVYNSTDTTGAPLLNGTTGVNGGVTFRLDENVRYTLVFSGGGIVNKTINIYPRDNKYYIIVSYDGDIFEEDISESNIIGITVTHYPGINGSVDVVYNDILDNTSALNFTIMHRELMGNFTFVATYDSFANMSNGEHRFILTDYSDKEYVVIINYTHAEYGDRQRNFGISYGNNIAVLNDIFSPFIKGMLSVFLLISVALIFSAANREIGAMIVSLTAAILHSMHWLDYFGVSTLILWAAISLALIVSIAANFGKKGKEEGY